MTAPIEGLQAGGKERQLAESIKYFNRKTDLEIGLITFKEQQHYAEILKSEVSYFKVLKKRPTRLEPFFSIWLPIKKFQPDIIHTWDILSSSYALQPSKLLKIPLIDGSIRDAGVEKGWHKLLKEYVLKKADLIIANSVAGLNYYGVRGNVIYNGINSARFLPKHKKNEEVNAIMVANFTAYKDHETFIKATTTLLSSQILDNIYLAGSGPNLEYFRSLVNDTYPSLSKRFHFLGRISNVEEYLTKCKYGILCSTRNFGEGVPNAVLEYMAAGLVPIATKIGGVLEIIDHKKNGFLVEAHTPDEITQTIKNLEAEESDHRINEITYCGMKTIEEKFSYHSNMAKLLDIYSLLCEK